MADGTDQRSVGEKHLQAEGVGHLIEQGEEPDGNRRDRLLSLEVFPTRVWNTGVPFGPLSRPLARRFDAAPIHRIGEGGAQCVPVLVRRPPMVFRSRTTRELTGSFRVVAAVVDRVRRAPMGAGSPAGTPNIRRVTQAAGHEAGGPGSLKIEPAGDAVHIEDLPGKVQAGHDPALHRVEVHLVEGDAPAGHELLLEGGFAGDRVGVVEQAIDQPVARLFAELRPR